MTIQNTSAHLVQVQSSLNFLINALPTENIAQCGLNSICSMMIDKINSILAAPEPPADLLSYQIIQLTSIFAFMLYGIESDDSLSGAYDVLEMLMNNLEVIS